MIQGIDISDFQKVVVWPQIPPNIKFVYAQATYGCKVGSSPGAEDDYRNWTFYNNHDGARNAGIFFGAYHFFMFNQDPIAQARAFLDYTTNRLGNLLPMVDVEGDSGTTGSVAGNVKALSWFTTAVEKVVGKPMVIYTGEGFWDAIMGGSDAFSGHPLFVANYGVLSPAIPQGWTDYKLWQYTSGLVIPGINGFVDGDYFKGVSLSEIER